MNRRRLTVLAVAGAVCAAGVPVAAEAQIADALVHAEQLCLGHGIAPNSAAFNACVERAALAYDRQRPGLAEHEAGIARAARSDCLRYGLDPHTLGYRACVKNEIDGRSAIAPASPAHRLILHPLAR